MIHGRSRLDQDLRISVLTSHIHHLLLSAVFEKKIFPILQYNQITHPLTRKICIFFNQLKLFSSLKFPARIVPTPLFLAIYAIMTSFPQKQKNKENRISFLELLTLTYSLSLLLWFKLNFQTWVTQQVGHGQSTETFLTSNYYDVTTQEQNFHQNYKNLLLWVIVNSSRFCSIWGQSKRNAFLLLETLLCMLCAEIWLKHDAYVPMRSKVYFMHFPCLLLNFD